VIVTWPTEYVAIIPARAGSKRIPRKNLQKVGGRTLIEWSIEHVRAARRPLRAVVTTDDPEIARHAADLGAEVPTLRPPELATDHSPTEPALLHTLSTLPGAEHTKAVVLLQPTSPVRLPQSVDGAIDLYESSGASSVFSAVSAPPFLWRGQLSPRPLYDIAHRPRSQDVPPAQQIFRENGSVYVTSLTHLGATGNRLGPDAAMFVMAPEEGIDIDDPLDIALAELVLTLLVSTGHASR